MTPCRAMLEATAHRAGVPHAALADGALLLALLEVGAYPPMYRLDLEPAPAWMPVAVVCEECVSRRWTTTAHIVHVCTDLLGPHPAAYATVRCPSCESLLAVPLRGLDFWRWRWRDEATRAHTVWRGLGSTPERWWQPAQWGEPIPSLLPSPPPPVPAHTQEAALPVALSQPVAYHIHTLHLSLLGYLRDGEEDAEGGRIVSVDLPLDATDRAAAIQEILRLSGRDPSGYATYMEQSAVRVRARRGMSSGQWWPRAQLPESEELGPEAPGQILDLHPTEEE